MEEKTYQVGIYFLHETDDDAGFYDHKSKEIKSVLDVVEIMDSNDAVKRFAMRHFPDEHQKAYTVRLGWVHEVEDNG